MSKFFPIILLLAALSLSACSSNELATVAEQKLSLSEQADSIKTSQICHDRGGNWRKVGKLQRASCVLPTSDAGKMCTDSKQCQVSCITLQDNILPGSKITGQCHDSTDQFGCRTYVTNGQAEATLCVD